MLRPLILTLALVTAPAVAEPIMLDVKPIPLDASQPARTTIGKLEWRGGLEISSRDRRFGGYSGLVMQMGGQQMVAASDVGHFLTAKLTYTDGRLTGLEQPDWQPLRGLDGQPVTDKVLADAEALRRDIDGSWLVTFERQHRVWRYPNLVGRGEAVEVPVGFDAQPDNGGPEALAVFGDGRWLVLSEDGRATPDILKAWLRQPDGTWSDLGYRTTGIFVPTDAVALSNGDLLVVERRFTRELGVACRLMHVKGDTIRAGAVLEGTELAAFAPPVSVDNLEAVDAALTADGGVRIWLLADDNQNPQQRTLLMHLLWTP